MAVSHLMLLDYIRLFTVGFMLYMIKTQTGRQWQNILGVLVAAGIFHTIDHGKHNPLAIALIIGLVTASVYGRVPPLRFKPLVDVSTISYALYLCHNNLHCALIYRSNQAVAPPQLGFGIVFAFALSILITNRIGTVAPATAKKHRSRTTSRAKSNLFTRRFGKQTMFATPAASFLPSRAWGLRTKPRITSTAC